MQLSRDEFVRVSQWKPVRGPVVLNRGRLTTATTWHAESPVVERMVPTPEAEQLSDVVAELPDSREEIVACLKARVESGTYQVGGEQIAEMMLRRFLADRMR